MTVPEGNHPSSAASWDQRFLVAFTSCTSDPDNAVSQIWDLYLTCPGGRHGEVGTLAVDAAASATSLTALTALFAKVTAASPPDDFEAAACYWKIIQIIGEGVVGASKRADIRAGRDSGY
jgi:hypothetical protein